MNRLMPLLSTVILTVLAGAAFGADDTSVKWTMDVELDKAVGWLVALGAIVGIFTFVLLFLLFGFSIYVSALMTRVPVTLLGSFVAGFITALLGVPGLFAVNVAIKPWDQYRDLIDLVAWILLVALATSICFRPGFLKSILIGIISQIIYVLILLIAVVTIAICVSGKSV